VSRLVDAPYRAYTSMISASDNPTPKSRITSVGFSSLGRSTSIGRSVPAATCESRAFVAYSRSTASGASAYRFVSTDITCAIPDGSMLIAVPDERSIVPETSTVAVGFCTAQHLSVAEPGR